MPTVVRLTERYATHSTTRGDKRIPLGGKYRSVNTYTCEFRVRRANVERKGDPIELAPADHLRASGRAHTRECSRASAEHTDRE
jgi:hypothetical protein